MYIIIVLRLYAFFRHVCFILFVYIATHKSSGRNYSNEIEVRVIGKSKFILKLNDSCCNNTNADCFIIIATSFSLLSGQVIILLPFVYRAIFG